MYLSHLLIDVGDNPDRPRPGRLWLRNLYRVHQRLCMAFPSPSRVSDDADFLKPFKPEDFNRGQVHVSRGTDTGFLFRIDIQSGGRAVILVQSAIKPNWDYAFQNAGYLLAALPEVKPFDPRFVKGEPLRFRLVTNPTKKRGTPLKEERQSLSIEEWKSTKGRNGRRVPVPADQLLDWLAQRAERAGFALEADSVTVQAGYVYVDKTGNGAGEPLRSARYDGTLRITDVALFRDALAGGIGPAKGFGFGLLSVARLRG